MTKQMKQHIGHYMRLYLLLALFIAPLSRLWAQATPPEGAPVVTLSVKGSSLVQFLFKAATNDTPAWIETAPNNYIPITVNSDWSSILEYGSGAGSITVHGSITGLELLSASDVTAVNASGNPGIIQLRCSGKSNLSSINVSGCTALQELWCGQCTLTQLDVSSCTELTELNCERNSLNSLSVSNLAKLKSISISNNPLNQLSVSGCTSLYDIAAFNTSLSTPAINRLYCELPTRQESDQAHLFLVDSKPTPPQVVTESNAQIARDKHWGVVDLGTYKEIPTTGIITCNKLTPPANAPFVTITVKENATVRIDVMPKMPDNEAWVETAPGIYHYIKITSGDEWAGSQDFTATGTTIKVYGDLYGIQCDNNTDQITGIDVSSSPNLKRLMCNGNNITSLNLTQNPGLELLDCSFNQNLSELLFAQNSELNVLDYSATSLRELNLSSLVKLYTLICYEIPSLNTTAAFNKLYCNLPALQAGVTAKIYPAKNPEYINNANLLASSGAIAMAKGWELQYFDDRTEIITTGSLTCELLTPPANAPVIEFTASKLNISFALAEGSTLAWVETEPGEFTTVELLGNSWCESLKFSSQNGSIRLHGNVAYIDCGNSTDLTEINSAGNAKLKSLNCTGNSLEVLDFSANTALMYLDCFNNKRLRSLNVKGCAALKRLNFSYTAISALDISGNSQLKNIECKDTRLSSAALNSIYCALPAREATDNAVITPAVENNGNPVDLAAQASSAGIATAKGWKVQYENGTDISTTGTTTCEQLIPPANAPVITLTVIPNESIHVTMQGNAENTPVWIEPAPGMYIATTVSNLHPMDAEYTTVGTTMKIYGNITGFNCSRNIPSITGINVENNPGLKELNCSENFITTLDLSHNPELELLVCHRNALQKLDLSHNPKIKEVFCKSNESLQTLILKGCNNLEYLYCEESRIAELDLSSCPNLKRLYASDNALTALDLSHNPELETLDCAANQWLRELNLSGKPALREVMCYSTGLSSAAINSIYCDLPTREAANNAQLMLLESYSSPEQKTAVLNSNAAIVTEKGWKVINRTGNPVTTTGTSTCGEVGGIDLSDIHKVLKVNASFTLTATVHPHSISNKEVTWSSENSSIASVSESGVVTAHAAGITKIIATASANSAITAECMLQVYDEIPSEPVITLTVTPGATINLRMRRASSESSMVAIETAPGVFNTYLLTTETIKLPPITAGSTQLKVHGKIRELNCGNNGKNLTAIDVSNNTLLTGLYCYDNSITELNLTQNTALEELNCGQNNLTSLDISKNSMLYSLSCVMNQITELNVSGNPKLSDLITVGNPLSSAALNGIYCDLPTLTGSGGTIIAIESSSDANYAQVVASAGHIATTKGWYITDGFRNIIRTKGTHTCGAAGGVLLSQAEQSLNPGQSFALTATVQPYNAINKEVTWSSSDESIATVANGVVTAHKGGIANITVTTVDGGHTATCMVMVSGQISIATGIAHGTLTTSHNENVTMDTEVTITATPAVGYKLAEGSLRAYKTGDESAAVTITNGKFAMPAHDVTVTAEFDMTTGIDTPKITVLDLHPNPTSDNVYINGITTATRVEIYNLAGVQVLSTQVQPNQPISLADLKPGMYLMKVNGQTLKITKH